MERVKVLAVVAVLFVGACGGGGGDDEDTVAASSASTSTTTTTTAPPDSTVTTAPPDSTVTTIATATTTTRAPARTAAAPTTTASTAAPNTTAPPPPQTTTTTTSTPPPSGQATITIQNFAYSPVVLQVAAGTDVKAVNKDSANHTWTADDGSWDSGALAKDGEFVRRFTSAGTFAYHCAIHPSMKGSVQVSG